MKKEDNENKNKNNNHGIERSFTTEQSLDKENSTKENLNIEKQLYEKEEHLIGEMENLSDLAQRVDQNRLTDFSQKSLLGEFGENNQYSIREQIGFELTSLNKIITQKSTNEFKAYAMCGGIRFTFSVEIKEILETHGDKTPIQIALLKIHESYYKSSEKKDLVTAIARFQETANPNFLLTVKKVFNLNTEEEAVGKSFNLTNEDLAPITLAGFKNRFYQYEIIRIQKQNAEISYVKALLKVLREDKNGDVVVKNFLLQTKFGSRQGGKKTSSTELKNKLDELINDAIGKNLLSKITVLKIDEIRDKFAPEFKQDKQKELANKGSVIPGKLSTTKTAGKGGASTSGKSGSKGGSKGGNKKSKGKDKGKGKGKDKKDKKDGLFSVEEFFKEFGKKDKTPESKTPTPIKVEIPTPAKNKPLERQQQPVADSMPTGKKFSKRIDLHFEYSENLNPYETIEPETQIIVKKTITRHEERTL